MQMLWGCDIDGLACRWSDAGQHASFSAEWMREPSAENYCAKVPAQSTDLRTISPFGGQAWYLPPVRLRERRSVKG